MLGKIESRRRRGWQRMRWLEGITNSMYMSLSRLGELMMDSLVRCTLWGHKELITTKRLNWNMFLRFLGGSVVKNPAMQRTCRRCSFDPWVRKILWSRKWQPTSSFLPRKSNGQKSLIATVHGVEKNWTRLRDSTTNKKMCFYVKTTLFLCVSQSIEKHGFNAFISHSYFFFLSFLSLHHHPPPPRPHPWCSHTSPVNFLQAFHLSVRDTLPVLESGKVGFLTQINSRDHLVSLRFSKYRKGDLLPHI